MHSQKGALAVTRRSTLLTWSVLSSLLLGGGGEFERQLPFARRPLRHEALASRQLTHAPLDALHVRQRRDLSYHQVPICVDCKDTPIVLIEEWRATTTTPPSCRQDGIAALAADSQRRHSSGTGCVGQGAAPRLQCSHGGPRQIVAAAGAPEPPQPSRVTGQCGSLLPSDGVCHVTRCATYAAQLHCAAWCAFSMSFVPAGGRH